MNQKTISNSIKVSGVGLHTGKTCNVTLHPAKVHHGIKFKLLVDNNESVVIPADASKVTDTQRSTKLTVGDHSIQTVEHLLAALYALEISNVLIEVDSNELPILDGSSKKWIKALEESGIDEQETQSQIVKVRQTFEYHHEPTGAHFTVLPAEGFNVTVNIDFNSKVIPPQFAVLSELNDFTKEIAPCRTFVFLHDVITLHRHGLIKGGQLDNAVIVVENVPEAKEIEDLKSAFPNVDVSIDEPGCIAKGGLLYPNELARHKLLDFLGDLALCGFYIEGRITVSKPSHEANTAFALAFKEFLRVEYKNRLAPNIDPAQPSVYDINQITDVLPHRYPFLLVDKILELAEDRVVGLKNITTNEPFFQGHFPNNPIMPGVLQIEAMAQTGGILAISLLPKDKKYDTYFLKIDNAKFKAKVIPGDTLVITMDLLEPIRRGICRMLGRAFVGNTLVTEAELTAQLVPREDA